jgi:putative transposase
MARKLRLEYPGAIYHVINRGNYRTDIFQTDGAKAAFEACLFEVCRKSGWVLHAFVLMGNHYHLAVETPEGNLAAGMQWLQTTFANRFNRLRGERGHLFQGRYKSLLVEAGAALGQVCHYLHLNPVRAGIVPVERLKVYRYSSYWYLRRPKKRPQFLSLQTALAEAGGWADTNKGWAAYAKYMVWQAEEGPAGKGKAYACLSRGWALGSAGFKTELIKDHNLTAISRAWEAAGAKEIRTLHWGDRLAAGLACLGKKSADVRNDRKSSEWKAALAGWMKQGSQASNAWLADQLNMGRAEAVSVYVGRLKIRGLAHHPLIKKLGPLNKL